MTRDERRSELNNQLLYYKQELAHLRELPRKNLLGVTQACEELLLRLITNLHQELWNISVYPRASANGFVL